MVRGRWEPPPVEEKGSRKGQGKVAGGQLKTAIQPGVMPTPPPPPHLLKDSPSKIIFPQLLGLAD